MKKIVIANRGEVALRILRACKEMGIATVALYSEEDEKSIHVRLADESVCIGPAPSKDSYLNVAAVISACHLTGADGVHPGYGFLSENAHFARLLEEHGIVFIGAKPEHIALMGHKIQARETAEKLGIPVVPGYTLGQDIKKIKKQAQEIGYPVLFKAASGGGGRGMSVVTEEKTLKDNLQKASREAQSAFGDGSMYMEKYLDKPRHIEIQVMGDQKGNVLCLGERDCSLQRRHQKVLEEAPAPHFPASVHKKMMHLVEKSMRAIGYVGLGTVEFLYKDGTFYFIEMNTRLQVEHPITEMITGMDLVKEQILIAQGEPCAYAKAPPIQGHAIECRINAEDPFNFRACPGLVSLLNVPGGLGVRMDTACFVGAKISPYYDSLLGKLIVHAPTRKEALARLKRALQECAIEGITTNIALFSALLEAPDFQKGNYHIQWLESWLETYQGAQQ